MPEFKPFQVAPPDNSGFSNALNLATFVSNQQQRQRENTIQDEERAIEAAGRKRATVARGELTNVLGGLGENPSLSSVQQALPKMLELDPDRAEAMITTYLGLDKREREVVTTNNQAVSMGATWIIEAKESGDPELALYRANQVLDHYRETTPALAEMIPEQLVKDAGLFARLGMDIDALMKWADRNAGPDAPSGYRAVGNNFEFVPGGPADPVVLARNAAATDMPTDRDNRILSIQKSYPDMPLEIVEQWADRLVTVQRANDQGKIVAVDIMGNILWETDTTTQGGAGEEVPIPEAGVVVQAGDPDAIAPNPLAPAPVGPAPAPALTPAPGANLLTPRPVAAPPPQGFVPETGLPPGVIRQGPGEGGVDPLALPPPGNMPLNDQGQIADITSISGLTDGDLMAVRPEHLTDSDRETFALEIQKRGLNTEQNSMNYFESVKKGVGPWSSFRAFIDTVGNGLLGLPLMFEDTASARTQLRGVERLYQNILVQSPRIPVYEQALVKNIFPDPDKFWGSPDAAVKHVLTTLGVAKEYAGALQTQLDEPNDFSNTTANEYSAKIASIQRFVDSIEGDGEPTTDNLPYYPKNLEEKNALPVGALYIDPGTKELMMVGERN